MTNTDLKNSKNPLLFPQISPLGQGEKKGERKKSTGNQWALDLADSLDLGGSSLPAISAFLAKRENNYIEAKSTAQTIRLIGGRVVTIGSRSNPNNSLASGENNILAGSKNKKETTEFQAQFKTKQKVKHLYGGLSEGWLKRLAHSNLISLIETRLDVAVFRLQWADSIRKAQTLIKKGLITIDGKVVKYPSHLVKIGNAVILHPTNLLPEAKILKKQKREDIKNNFPYPMGKIFKKNPSVLTSHFKQTSQICPQGNPLKSAVMIKYPQQSTLHLPSTLSLNVFKCAMNKYIGF